MKHARKYYSLIDKVYDYQNLNKAWKAVKANKGSAGIDGQTVTLFELNLSQNLLEIQRLIMQERYEPEPVLRQYIPKSNGKKRPLGIPTVRDRVCQQAVRQVIEPLFDSKFYEHSYGFRLGRSQHQAVDVVRRAKRSGYVYVVDLDIQSYFDTIQHHILMDKVKGTIADSRVLNLIQMWLKAGIMEDDQFYDSETGSPQGGVISPLLANIYLDAFDWEMKRQGYPVVRFADDAIIFCRSKARAEKAHEAARSVIEGELALTMHPEKTKVVSFEEGFRFLGFNFWKDYLVLPEARMKTFKDDIRYATRRQQGKRTEDMIERLNQIIQGFTNYFKIGNVRSKFTRLDKWIRSRVRAYMIKKRTMNANMAISNKTLSLLGLISMENSLTNRS